MFCHLPDLVSSHPASADFASLPLTLTDLTSWHLIVADIKSSCLMLADLTFLHFTSFDQACSHLTSAGCTFAQCMYVKFPCVEMPACDQLGMLVCRTIRASYKEGALGACIREVPTQTPTHCYWYEFGTQHPHFFFNNYRLFSFIFFCEGGFGSGIFMAISTSSGFFWKSCTPQCLFVKIFVRQYRTRLSAKGCPWKRLCVQGFVSKNWSCVKGSV